MVERHTLNRIDRTIETLTAQLMAKPVCTVWVEERETAEQAKARFLAQHPEAASYELVLLGWLPPGSESVILGGDWD